MQKKTIKKIAVFKALQLGDLLCSVPALRALRKAFPTAEITLIGLPWAHEFVKRFNKYIDAFIPFPDPLRFHSQISQKERSAILQKIQQEQFDLLIQLHGDGRITNPIAAHFGAKKLAGSFIHGNCCPDKKTFVVYNDKISEVQRNLAVLANLEIPPLRDNLDFPITQEDKNELQQLPIFSFLQFAPFVCIHPGARDPRRRWNPNYFALVADRLIDAGYQVVLTGVAEEKQIVQQVIMHMQFQPINVCGVLSLGATAALLSSSQLLISNCTAVSHLADALAISSITLFLDSDPVRWAPHDKTLHKIVLAEQARSPNYVCNLARDTLNAKFKMQSSKLQSKTQNFTLNM